MILKVLAVIVKFYFIGVGIFTIYLIYLAVSDKIEQKRAMKREMEMRKIERIAEETEKIENNTENLQAIERMQKNTENSQKNP